MTDQSELTSRAALCRKLAQREPANRMFWMAEAENWSRLSKEKIRGEDEDGVKIDSGILTRLRAQSTRFRFILA
jgi:hypothetical protein